MASQKKLSGVEFRRKVKINADKIANVISNTKKLNSFFQNKFKKIFSTRTTVHFRSFLLTLSISDDLPNTVIEMYSLIIKNNYQDLYPYVGIALRICSSSITNCSAERSFLVLKRVKSYLRSSTTDDRLNYLAILIIEPCLTKKLDYDDICRYLPLPMKKTLPKHFLILIYLIVLCICGVLVFYVICDSINVFFMYIFQIVSAGV